MKTFCDKIDALVALGEIFDTDQFKDVMVQAEQCNPWFTPFMIESAVKAIRSEMLCREKLNNWLKDYYPVEVQQTVGIIMAGNIPMVGFFDLLVAFVAGHNIIVKPSSKDRHLMIYVIEKLVAISGANITIVERIEPHKIDFLLAMGSDSTAQILQDTYKYSTNIIRGSRHSIARLTGNETPQQLQLLSEDLFLYWGMGCRNITHLLLPADYDFGQLIEYTRAYESDYYNQKFSYEKAMTMMRNVPHIAANGCLFVPMDINQTPPVSVVGYSHYDPSIVIDPNQLQCTIGLPKYECNTSFGRTQFPTLQECPNGINPLEILLAIKANAKN